VTAFPPAAFPHEADGGLRQDDVTWEGAAMMWVGWPSLTWPPA